MRIPSGTQDGACPNCGHGETTTRTTYIPTPTCSECGCPSLDRIAEEIA